MEEMTVTALQDIEANSYLYMDYAETEDYLFKQFPCSCGSENCRELDHRQTGITLSRTSIKPKTESRPPQTNRRVSCRLMKRNNLLTGGKELIFATSSNIFILLDVRVADLARQFGTPAFVYSAQRVKENIARVKNSFADNRWPAAAPIVLRHESQPVCSSC